MRFPRQFTWLADSWAAIVGLGVGAMVGLVLYLVVAELVSGRISQH